MRIDRLLAGMLAVTLPCFSLAQQDTLKEIERYRQLLQESNPAELYEARGAEHWKRERGPKNSSLERCDLGPDPAWSRAPTCGCRAILQIPTACRTSSRAS